MKSEVDATSPASSGVRGLSTWAEHYDLLLCDVWGVVHDGLAAIPEAMDALQRFRRGGGTVVLLTNAPRPRTSIVGLLDRMGVPHDSYDALISSGDVVVEQMLARGDAPVHHLGPPRDDPLFETAASAGWGAPRVPINEARYVVCTGLLNDGDQPEAYDPMLRSMKARDLPFICANPDIVVHTGDTLLWCAGAIAARYAALGGPVTLIGKPHPLVYEAARRAAQTIRGQAIANARILAVGDGIGTDILGAATQGIDSILITSGIHRDRIRIVGPDGTFTVEPAAYAELAREAGATPTGHMHTLEW